MSKSHNGNQGAAMEPTEEGDFWALRDVSFEIEEGKTIGVVGANGAGKSTLLKIISRITAPTNGSIKIKGRIGSLLEVGTGFHPELTGRDNVFLNGAILGMSRAEVRAKFDDIVAFAAVEQFIDTPVKRYSSGMYVRLAFAVSAFLEPEILILDEILAVGDLGFRAKCFKRLEELVSSHHTILFVAHDVGLVTKFCDRAIWLEKGVLKAYGPAEVVTEGYQKTQAKVQHRGRTNGVRAWRNGGVCRYGHRTPQRGGTADGITRVRRTVLRPTRLRAPIGADEGNRWHDGEDSVLR